MKRSVIQLALSCFLMSLLMSGAVSFVHALLEIEHTAFQLSAWINSWFQSLLIAFPVSMLASPAIQKLSYRS